MKLYVLQIVFKVFSFLPLSVLRLIGSLVGIIMIRFSKRSGKRLKSNLLVTGICNDANVDIIALDAAKEWGRTLVESVIVWQRSKLYSNKLILKVTNFAEVEAAAKKGPIVFLTPHIGNFEVALKDAALRIPNKSFNVLFKPNKDPVFNAIMLKGRQEDNINPVPTTRHGVAKLLRALKDGEFIGILPDNVASGGDGVWVNFFGIPVFATTLAAKFVLFPGVTTFVASSKRVKHGFTVNYQEYKPATMNVSEVVQDIYGIIERMVLESPSQYYWSYDRFRKPDHAPDINSANIIT